MIVAAVVAFVVAAAPAAASPVLVDVTEVNDSAWHVGDVVFVAVDGANLRATPESNGKLVALPAFGSEVVILEVKPEPVKVGESLQRWYRVKAGGAEGFLFGTTLTPLLGKKNLDDDNNVEGFSVTFTGKHVPLVRLWNVEDVFALASVELKSPGAGAQASFFDVASVAGHGLIGVRTCLKDVCRDALIGQHQARALVVAEAAGVSSSPPAVRVSAEELEHKLTNTFPEPRRAPTADQLIAFFGRDCAGVVTVDVDEMGMPAPRPACGARDFEQNCSPDRYGCEALGEACLDRCAQPCMGCQSTCATACDGCKSKCKGELLCLRGCAQSRSTCHSKCLTLSQTCRDSGCSSVVATCEERAVERMATECGDACGALKACQEQLYSPGEWAKCPVKGMSPWCVAACSADN